MKQKKLSLLQLIFIVFYSLCIYIYAIKIIQPELHYHLKQPPFLANMNFFSEYISYPGGLIEYCATFLYQFFYFGWVGSIIILFTGLAFLYFSFLIFKKFELDKLVFFWIFLPFILLIALFNNYYFTYSSALEILFSYFAIWLFSISIKKINIYVSYLLIGIICYYIAGSGSFMVYSVTAIVFTLFVKGSKKGLLFFVIVGLIAGYFPYLVFKYLFNISLADAYFKLIPDTATVLLYRPNIIFYLFIFCLPLGMFVFYLFSKIIRLINQGKLKLILLENIFRTKTLKWVSFPFAQTVIIVIIVVIVSIFAMITSINAHKKNIVLSDFYCYTEQWDKAVGIAVSDPQYDIFINLNYNRSIDNVGHLLDLFFDYPQLMGTVIIFPDKLGTSEISMPSSDYYYDLGYISEALHWAHEAQTSQPYSPRILKRMVMANLVFGNYLAAKKYIDVLGYNFLSKDFVKKYKTYIEDTSLVKKDDEIMLKRSFIPHGKVVADIRKRFQDLYDQNKNNKRAYDYLQLFYLLNQEFKPFLNLLPEGKKFYSEVPALFEDAILIYFYGTDKTKIDGLKISVRAKNALSDYLKILKQYNNDKNAARSSLAGLYGDTYFYYLMYNSPEVTKIKYEVRDINDYKK